MKKAYSHFLDSQLPTLNIPLRKFNNFIDSGVDLESGYPAIDAPGGFLFEWWSVFWDIFIARTNEKHSEVAASYIEVGFDFISIFQL